MIKPDLKKKEPLLLNRIPRGTNSLNSRASFLQKKLYEKVAFTEQSLSENEPIDMWYEKMMYGRVTNESKTVHISESKLKQLPGTELFVVDFVYDAFKELQSYFRFLAHRGVTCDDSNYHDLRAEKAWENVNEIYHDMMISLYEKFKVYMSTKDNRLLGFASFMNLFTSFLDTVSPIFPITRSKLVLSRANNPRSSGLIIETSTASHAEDQRKYVEFIQDPNFPIFKDSAMKHGFLVDKHAPWRLVADLSNPVMQDFMKKRGTTLDTFFKDYYYDTEMLDLETLKVYIIQFYNSYVSSKASFIMPKIEYCNGRPKVENEQVFREMVSNDELNESLPEDFWIRVYSYIRGREENQVWNQSDFEKIVKNSYYMKKGLDMSHAIRYISDEARFSSESSRKNRNYRWLG